MKNVKYYDITRPLLQNVGKVLRIRQATDSGWIACPLNGVFDYSYPSSKLRRGRVQGEGKITPAVTAGEASLAIWLGYEET